MPANDNSSGAAVVEIVPSTGLARALTLFQIEESLVLLAESAEEEGLTPEIEQALTVYLEGAAEKRDRVADFIHFCEGMAELAKAEGKRLGYYAFVPNLDALRRGKAEADANEDFVRPAFRNILPTDLIVATGVDLAIGKKKTNARTLTH